MTPDKKLFFIWQASGPKEELNVSRIVKKTLCNEIYIFPNEIYQLTKEGVIDVNVKLYVGNLPYSATNEQLTEMFSKAGTVVSAMVITDRMSGRSKGFGFVEMAGEDEAKEAIKMFNEQELDGRKIVVNEARPRRDEGSSSDRRSFGRPAASEEADEPQEGDLK